MKTLICTTPGQFTYADTPVPERKQGETLLRIRRVGICGTDLHAYEGTQPFFQYPRILGHELAAEIVATDEPGFTAGESVTIIPYFHCGNCVACRTGKTNCCTQLKVCGVHVDGGMREYLLVPSNSLVKSRGLGLDELALVEPLAIGAHGIRRAQVIPGEWVAVIGAGPIGLGVMEFARINGANVIAVDVQENRLQFCKERLQIPFTINAAKENVSAQLAQLTNGDMPTVVIDATGNLSAINESFRYLAHGGRYVLVGLQKGEIRFSHPGFHQCEATLMSSRNATREDFDRVIDALLNGQVLPLTYITHRVLFEEVQEAFPGWLLPANQVIKAMVTI